MKTINQIITVIIFLGLIFLFRNDLTSLYSKAVSYIQNGITQYTSIYKSDYKDKVDQAIVSLGNDLNLNNNTKQINKIETPGPLVVPKDYLTTNTKSINLSIKGVINITNIYRASNGSLPPLTENPKLDFSAEKKLQDMFQKGYFEHISPDGVGVGDLGTLVSYEYIIIGENLALGNFKNDQALVDAWMASPGHKANILNKRYTEIGVAVGKGLYNGENVWMAVQHFALPKSACPSINEVLRGIITIDQDKIKTIEGDLASKKANIDTGAVYEGQTTNGQIDSYNSLVSDYNKIIVDIKEKINTYNAQVRDFNNCIEGVN
jgi:uncharacterized protein YkwD